jgi:hypothetical protein
MEEAALQLELGANDAAEAIYRWGGGGCVGVVRLGGVLTVARLNQPPTESSNSNRQPPPPKQRDLLALNPDNYRMHEGLRAALGLAAPPGGELTAAQRGTLAEVYRQLAAEYPKSPAVQRIPLDFTVRSLFFGALGSLESRGAAAA